MAQVSQAVVGDPINNDSPQLGQGPGAGAATWVATLGVGVYQVALIVVLTYVLLEFWPHPTPSGRPEAGAAPPAPAGTRTVKPRASPPGGAPGAGTTARAHAAPHSTGRDGARNAARDGDSTGVDTVRAGTTRTDTTHRDTAGRDTTHAGRGVTSGSVRYAPGPGVHGAPGQLRCDKPTDNWAPSDTIYDPECVSLVGHAFPVWSGQRLLVLVIVAGALGALFRGLGSLGVYIGARSLIRSWLPQYYFQPFKGAILGVFFYFLFRGGLFSANAGFQSTDPVGFMALATLVGIFEQEATAKLRQIATALFTSPDTTTDKVTSAQTTPQTPRQIAPQIVKASPAKLGVNTTDRAALKLTLQCTGVRPGVHVFVTSGAVPVKRELASGDVTLRDGELDVQLRPEDVQSAGQVAVTVRNLGDGTVESKPFTVDVG